MMPFWQDCGTRTDTQLIVEKPKDTSSLSIWGLKVINIKHSFILYRIALIVLTTTFLC